MKICMPINEETEIKNKDGGKSRQMSRLCQTDEKCMKY